LVLLITGSVWADNTGSGGTITYTDSGGLNPVSTPPYVGGYVVHTFTANGTLIIPSSVSANMLVVAGGGGGGGLFGSGGAAGGLIYTNLSLGAGTYSATIGAGGNGVNSVAVGANGNNSVFSILTALGGGGGGVGYQGGPLAIAGNAGGSGGGSGGAANYPPGAAGTQPSSASGGFGNNGGSGPDTQSYGGGGGAGAAGGIINGGNGLPYAISGVPTYYAGGGGAIVGGSGGLGGGGNPGSTDNPGATGGANTGGGGGGGWNASGGSGGSGIIIVRYPCVANPPLSVVVTSPTSGQVVAAGFSISATAFVAGVTGPYSVTYHFKMTTNANYTATAAVGPFGATNIFTQTQGTLPVGTYQIYATVTDSTPTTGNSGTNTFTAVPPSAVLVQDILPSHIGSFVGDQIVFTAAYSNSPPASLQWQHITTSPAATNNINTGVINVTNTGVITSTLTLNNVQLTDAGSYVLEGLSGTALPACSSAASLVVSPPPPPLLRDVQTGYLLNYTFRAIRPYSWNQTPLLSGWESDSSGGSWLEDPSGFFGNNQFAFNVISFQLQDTNVLSAVTIKHQIARQTASKVTWEFRFMLPAAMDGAAWQLRDLNLPAVSIITQNGQLCYEMAGQPVALLPVTYGHEYGIKVVADVSARLAEIYVDGQLMAQATPFLNPVASLDYVLIKTGDAGTGNMYLPLVRVYRGYAVCETFAAGATNRVPDDWQTNGSASVQSFPCAAKPDAFSLNLTNGASVTKSFEADAGTNVVWEFKFLLPQKIDGAAAKLLVGNSPIFNIVTTGGNLSCSNTSGQLVPLVTNYLANLWYAVKAVADSHSGTAEIFVNGKLAQAAARFTPARKNFDGVRFSLAGLGTMWVDDVFIYPWHDYPADYVPEPKPVAVQDGHLLGVQSCSLWKEGDAYAGWEYVRPFAKTRKPFLGWYDDGSPEVADWEIKWQVEHGIGFELYCWYRPNDAINYPIKNGVLEYGIRDGLFNARYSQLKKFAIMYTDQGAGQTNPDDWRKNIVPYWIEYFFKDPRYLKINGKPVISIYYRDNFKSDFGGVTGAKQATDFLRAACAQAGFPGIIILMEERSADVNAMQEMKAMGIDCCYAYTWSTGDTASQRRNNLAQRDTAAKVGFSMIPSVSVGWQTSPWTGSPEGNGWAPVAAYKALAQWTKDEFMPTLPETSLGRKIVLLPNWNEFGEGHFIMPSALAGFGYVDALREVFTSGGIHEDLVPTEAQKHRFTVLYPKE
jgi:hypothetical protein